MRRKNARVTVSSEHCNRSAITMSDNLNLSEDSEELPDPGLPLPEAGSLKRRKSKAEQKEMQSHLDTFVPVQVEQQLVPRKKKGNNKKEAANIAREAKETNKREIESKREAVKRVMMVTKAANAESEANNKISKSAEGLQNLVMGMHPSLVSAWYMDDTLRMVAGLGVSIDPTNVCDPGLVLWARRERPTLSNGGLESQRAKAQACSRSLYVVSGDELEAMVSEGTFVEHIALMKTLANTPLTVLLVGLNRHLRKRPKNSQLNKQNIMQLQIELLERHGIDTLELETPLETAEVVVAYTRAHAEDSFKIAKRDIDEQAEFFMRGDNKNCVTVDKQGNGLSHLWEQMVAVLPQSSLEVARSLGAAYKTPSDLLQEFECADGISKVADIGIIRTKVPGAKTRRLGPEFARKLHTLFTAEDGNTLIE